MRIVRVLVAGLVALAGFASPVAANHQATPFHTTTRTTAWVCCTTRHALYDSFSMRTTFSWTAVPAQNQRANQNAGIKFTMDQHDLSHNVEAYSYTGSLPNPYFDTDDDNSDNREDEGEIVSEAPGTFPTAGTTYNTSIYWSHFYTVGGAWAYDSDGGTVEFDENLSLPGCPFFCDKWDTHSGSNVNWGLNKNYTQNFEGPQGASSSDQLQPAPARPSSAGAGRPPAGRSYRVASIDNPTDVRLEADLSQGLASYARNARLLAEETIASGTSDGVVTFNHPLSWDELATLEAAGLRPHQLELISAPAKDGLRWTVFVQNEAGRAQQADGIAQDAGIVLLGVVSANVTVPNRATLQRLQTSAAVYLVDLSITDYRRHNPGVVDVGQNDVYWDLAGWN